MKTKLRSTPVFVKKVGNNYEIKENANTIGHFDTIRGLVPSIFQESSDDFEFQISAILIEYEFSTKLIILTHFEYFHWVAKEIKMHTEEWEWYKDAICWTPCYGDNREFTKDGVLFAKNIYVSKTTGLPVSPTHDENGDILSTVISNYDQYYPTLKGAILDPLASWIDTIIV